MESWSHLEKILEKQIYILEALTVFNETAFAGVKRDLPLETLYEEQDKREEYLKEFELYQSILEDLKEKIEKEEERVNGLLQNQLLEKAKKIEFLLAKNIDLHRQLESLPKEIKNDIKQLRTQKKVNLSYQSIPILEESALLDQKK